MDQLIVQDKLIDGYNSAVGWGVIKAPKIGSKRIEKWKLDPIHSKDNSSDSDEDS